MRESEVGQISAQRLATARRNGQINAGRRGEFQTFEGGGRLHMQVPQDAVMNAVNSEGPEVMGRDGDGYWADMKRLHPETNTMPDKCIATGMRNRLGRVSSRTIYHDDGTRTAITS